MSVASEQDALQPLSIADMKAAAQAEVDRLTADLAVLRKDRDELAERIRARVEQLEEADRVNRALNRPRRTRKP